MEAQDILHNYNLKCTGCREGIIDTINEAAHALSEQEIRDKLSRIFNRTTFYRSFKTLIDKSVIHKIVINNQLVKYALNSTKPGNKEHSHFYCEKCHKVICLPEHGSLNIPLPVGFTVHETEITLKGSCEACNKV